MRLEPARSRRCTRLRAHGTGYGARWAWSGSAAPLYPGWLIAWPGRAGRTPRRWNMWEPRTHLLRQLLDALARPAVPAQPLPADRAISRPLISVTTGLSRSLMDGPPCRSGPDAQPASRP